MKSQHTQSGRGSTAQTISQILFLILFGALTFLGRIQLWFGIFLIAGMGVSLIWGRLYCRDVCPMGTAMRLESWIYGKLGIKRLATPSWMRHWIWNVLFLLAFGAAMLLTKRAGTPFPMLPALLGLSVVVSLVFEEGLFHRRICPFGTILSVTSRISRRGMKIDSSSCIGCGACERVCTTSCITRESDESKIRVIAAQDCIVCKRCEAVCPVDAITYRT
jgi:ferredoxin-type protein NapH